MNDFIEQMNERASQARTRLADARRDGDDYGASIHLGELDTLAKVAQEHGVTIDGLSGSHTAEEEIPLDKTA